MSAYCLTARVNPPTACVAITGVITLSWKTGTKRTCSYENNICFMAGISAECQTCGHGGNQLGQSRPSGPMQSPMREAIKKAGQFLFRCFVWFSHKPLECRKTVLQVSTRNMCQRNAQIVKNRWLPALAMQVMASVKSKKTVGFNNSISQTF